MVTSSVSHKSRYVLLPSPSNGRTVDAQSVRSSVDCTDVEITAETTDCTSVVTVQNVARYCRCHGLHTPLDRTKIEERESEERTDLVEQRHLANLKVTTRTREKLNAQIWTCVVLPPESSYGSGHVRVAVWAIHCCTFLHCLFSSSGNINFLASKDVLSVTYFSTVAMCLCPSSLAIMGVGSLRSNIRSVKECLIRCG